MLLQSGHGRGRGRPHQYSVGGQSRLQFSHLQYLFQPLDRWGHDFLRANESLRDDEHRFVLRSTDRCGHHRQHQRPLGKRHWQSRHLVQQFEALSGPVDNGASFSSPRNLSGTPGSSWNPQLFVDAAGNINVVWEESSPADIFFVRSGDAGATFSSAQNLSHNSGPSTNAWLTVDAGANINVAWEDTTPGNRDILFTRSTDSGATFLSTPLNLSNNSGLSEAVQIAADTSGDINVAC